MTILNQINDLAKDLDVSMNMALIRCIECGKHLHMNHNMIQRHYLEKHTTDQKNKIGKGWKFDKTIMPKRVKY